MPPGPDDQTAPIDDSAKPSPESTVTPCAKPAHLVRFFEEQTANCRRKIRLYIIMVAVQLFFGALLVLLSFLVGDATKQMIQIGLGIFSAALVSLPIKQIIAAKDEIAKFQLYHEHLELATSPETFAELEKQLLINLSAAFKLGIPAAG